MEALSMCVVAITQAGARLASHRRRRPRSPVRLTRCFRDNYSPPTRYAGCCPLCHCQDSESPRWSLKGAWVCIRMRHPRTAGITDTVAPGQGTTSPPISTLIQMMAALRLPFSSIRVVAPEPSILRTRWSDTLSAHRVSSEVQLATAARPTLAYLFEPLEWARSYDLIHGNGPEKRGSATRGFRLPERVNVFEQARHSCSKTRPHGSLELGPFKCRPLRPRRHCQDRVAESRDKTSIRLMGSPYPRPSKPPVIPASRRLHSRPRSSNRASPLNTSTNLAVHWARQAAKASGSSTVSRPPWNSRPSFTNTRTNCCTARTTDRRHATRANSKRRPWPSSSVGQWDSTRPTHHGIMLAPHLCGGARFLTVNRVVIPVSMSHNRRTTDSEGRRGDPDCPSRSAGLRRRAARCTSRALSLWWPDRSRRRCSWSRQRRVRATRGWY